ncbi:MAG: type I DNA topoisomerase [Rickettsiales bacterium]|nr:type I DNA topoisomerase [Rickettsiales bacterium]
MTHVVIVESPAKCKSINKYLGKDYKVLASYGHIRDLPSKDGSVLPDKDFEMKYQVASDSKKHVKAIEEAVRGADSLILATDPDREGESISWHVYDVLRRDKVINANFPVKRVSFNSITKEAVTQAMKNPRNIDMDLVNSQQARRALDYLVGFTLSPVLWRKLPGSRSAGRVQSVALRLICERENEIEKFKAQEYWSISALFENSSSSLIPANLTYADGKKLDKLAISDKGTSDKYLDEIKKRSFSVGEVEKKKVFRNPKPPFTTSTLQQEASRKLGFSASKTMMLAQRLYEGVKIGSEITGLITYMRTDGVSVAPEAITRTRETIGKNFGDKYLPEKPKFYASKQKNSQEAHEGIRPTDSARRPEMVASYLENDQLRLYDLIWKRMVASQMEAAVFNQVAADISSEDKKYIFRAVGNVLEFDGFLKLYHEDVDDGEDEDKENILPDLNQNDKLSFSKTPVNDNENGENPLAEQHFTQPPPRYNEASLVKKLEELGIGRPSTYASIISVIIDRGYCKIDKRRFYPEPRGRVVTGFLNEFFSKYVQYDFTSDLEEQLDLVSDGKLDWKQLLKNFWQDFKSTIDSTTEITITDVINKLEKSLGFLFGEAEDARKCPSCNDGTLGLKISRFGPFIGCSNYPTCNYTKKIESDNNNSDGENSQNSDGSEKPRYEKFEDKFIGLDKKTGAEIFLKKGPYGLYLELKGSVAETPKQEEKEEKSGKKTKAKKTKSATPKPKRVSIPKSLRVEDITAEKAEQLLRLPLELGTDAEGNKVTASVGMFGPYVACNKVFASVKGDLFEITLDEALQLIEEKKNKPKGAGRGRFKKKAK